MPEREQHVIGSRRRDDAAADGGVRGDEGACQRRQKHELKMRDVPSTGQRERRVVVIHEAVLPGAS